MGILIMKNYLAIIRKIDFVDLFKYGHFSISHAISFDGDMLAHANDTELFDALTNRMNMYEYSFEYLIIHFKSNDYDNQYISIDIRNVCALYTFDDVAKKEMSISFDPRIQLHVSPWSAKFDELQRNLSIKQSLRGIENLWTIFDLTEDDLVKCREIITPHIIQEVFRELYSYERPSGNQSIWTYLLRYERHSFYPKGMIGYFCDFIHVFCNYSKKQELSGEVAETTQLFPQIMDCKNAQFAPLIEIVEKSPLYKMTEDVAGCRFAVAAPLFLYLKAQFSEGIEHKPDEKFIAYAKEVGGFECSVAIFLLGLSLGYDKTYDSFYESAKLPFFKKGSLSNTTSDLTDDNEVAVSPFQNEMDEGVSKTNPSVENEIVSKDEETLLEHKKDVQDSVPKLSQTEKAVELKQGILFPEDVIDTEVQEQLPILWMRNKKQDVRPVFNEGEKSKLINLGYKPVKRFTDTVMKAIAGMGYNPEKEKNRFTTSKTKKKNSK